MDITFTIRSLLKITNRVEQFFKLEEYFKDQIAERLEVWVEEISAMERKMKAIESELEEWTNTNKSDIEIQQDSLPIVLNVGGTSFTTFKSTLLVHNGSLFDALLATDNDNYTQSNQNYFIDRSPKHFETILDFLRGNDISNCKEESREELEREFKFYKIPLPIIKQVRKSFLDYGRGLIFNYIDLLTPELQVVVQEWLPGKCFVLKYKASRDGFKGTDFHRICDNQGPTFTLILSSSNHLFGGFSLLSFSSPTLHFPEYKFDQTLSSFIFTLSNPHSLPPTRYFINPRFQNYTILCHETYGPLFGGGGYGCDLSVYPNSDKNSNSHFCFPTAYVDTSGKGNRTFTGDSRFSTREILVYCVV